MKFLVLATATAFSSLQQLNRVALKKRDGYDPKPTTFAKPEPIQESKTQNSGSLNTDPSKVQHEPEPEHELKSTDLYEPVLSTYVPTPPIEEPSVLPYGVEAITTQLADESSYSSSSQLFISSSVVGALFLQ